MVDKLERDINGLLEEGQLKDQRYTNLSLEAQSMQQTLAKALSEAETLRSNEIEYKTQISDLQEQVCEKNDRIT